MKKSGYFVPFFLYCTLSICAQNQPSLTDKIIEKLLSFSTYQGKATFCVTLPMTDDEARYEVQMRYKKNPKDTLLNIKYAIDIESDINKYLKNNFIQYSNGNLYHYTGQKLKEYHITENKAPFESRHVEGQTIYGVERSGLFYNELPHAIAEELQRKKKSSAVKIEEFPNMQSEGKAVDQLKITESWKGNILKITQITFDKTTGLPTHKEVENSPGHIGSQTVTTKYSLQNIDISFPKDYFTEKRLNQEKSEIMSTMRENNYQAISLKGKKSPRFSLSHPNQEMRLTNDDCLGQSTILLFADTTSSFCQNALLDLEQLGHKEGFGNVRFLVLYREKELPQLQNERDFKLLYPLCNAQNTALAFGVTGFPTIFVISPDGYVQDVLVGYSREMKQKIEQTIIY